MGKKSVLLLLVFCVPAMLSGLDTGIALQTVITKADHASSVALGPAVSIDYSMDDVELSLDLYSVVFIGSTVGMNLKVYYPLPWKFWQPRIGAGTGFAVNNRVIYTTSLVDFAVLPRFTWNAVVSADLFRFMFRKAGISILSIDVFTNINGASHEIGGALTLFRFISRNPHERN